MQQLLISSACLLWFSASPSLAAPISTDGSDPKTWDLKLSSTIAAADNHKIIFEDAYVRVLSVTVPAGTEEPYHLHLWPSVLVSDSPAKIIDRCAFGKACENKMSIDMLSVPPIVVAPPEALHSIKNLDTHAAHLTRVEFKTDIIPTLIHPDWVNGKQPISSDGSDPATWDTKLDGPIAAPTIHKIVFEDANIAVETVSTPAGATEPMHDHRYPAVKIDYSDLPSAPRVELMAPVPPHPGRNASTRATRIILIDFKHGFSEPASY